MSFTTSPAHQGSIICHYISWIAQKQMTWLHDVQMTVCQYVTSRHREGRVDRRHCSYLQRNLSLRTDLTSHVIAIAAVCVGSSSCDVIRGTRRGSKTPRHRITCPDSALPHGSLLCFAGCSFGDCRSSDIFYSRLGTPEARSVNYIFSVPSIPGE